MLFYDGQLLYYTCQTSHVGEKWMKIFIGGMGHTIVK